MAGGYPRFTTSDASGTDRLSLGQSDTDQGLVNIFGSSGTRLVFLGETTGHTGGLNIHDSSGTSRAYVGQFNNSSKYGFGAYDSSGSVVWSMP